MTARNGSVAGLLSRVTPSRATVLRLPPGLIRPCVRQIGRWVLDPGLPWEVQRRRLDQVTRSSPVPRGTSITGRVLNGVRAEVVTAGGACPKRTVLHFHGGGYCIGSPRMMRAWAAHLSARAGCRVVVPDYRLAPAHPHPAGLDDARAVMDALLAEGAPASIVVSGDSAGGGLALGFVLALRDAGKTFPPGACSPRPGSTSAGTSGPCPAWYAGS